MNKRNSLIFAAWLLCFGTVWAVFQQRTQLTRLQTAPQAPDLQAQPAKTAVPSAEMQSSSSSESSLTDEASRELLRLRGEVTRLTARKRELAGVAETAERLRAQLATGSTNSSGAQLPTGYLRKANAQLVGFSTPENTMQSWLWALQHHDATNLLRSMAKAGPMAARMQEGGGDLFKGIDVIPGLAIQSRQDLPDGSVDLQVYIFPDIPQQTMHLRVIDGEWKISGW